MPRHEIDCTGVVDVDETEPINVIDFSCVYPSIHVKMSAEKKKGRFTGLSRHYGGVCVYCVYYTQ